MGREGVGWRMNGSQSIFKAWNRADFMMVKDYRKLFGKKRQDKKKKKKCKKGIDEEETGKGKTVAN